MLIYCLKDFFKKNNDYICYLVGYENDIIQEYLKKIVSYLNLEKYIIFEGYQQNIVKYYEPISKYGNILMKLFENYCSIL